MSKSDWGYEPGNYHLICDECGFKFRRKEMRLRWDNLWVCKDDWETRQPQDFVTARIDVIVVDPVRSPPSDEFVTTDQCTAAGRAGIAGYAMAGCSLPSLVVGV